MNNKKFIKVCFDCQKEFDSDCNYCSDCGNSLDKVDVEELKKTHIYEDIFNGEDYGY